MQMPAAMSIACAAMVRASSAVWRASAFAAASAYAPPDPIAMIPSSGSIKSPVPDSRNVDLRVHDDQHRFETAQQPIGTPVLGQLDGRAFEVAPVLFELGLETREQRKRVGRRTGKTREDAIVVEPPDFPGGLLDDRVAEGDLAVAGHHGLAVVAHSKHCRGMEHRRRDLDRVYQTSQLECWRGLLVLRAPRGQCPRRRDGD